MPLFTVLASHPSSQAREAGGGVIVDPATAVLFTFTTAGTTTEFTFTPGANNIGEKSLIQVTQWYGGIAIVRE